MNRRTLIGFFFVIVASMVCVDRMSKMWAAGNLQQGVIGYDFGPIAFTLVHNEGAAFGMGQGNGWLFIVIALVIVLVIVGWLLFAENPRTFEVVCTALIAAGGIGNMIDRVTTVYVVDFIEFTFIDFPVFNVADICVTCGVAFFIVFMFVSVRSDQQEIFAELEEKSAAERAERRAKLQEQERAARPAGIAAVEGDGDGTAGAGSADGEERWWEEEGDLPDYKGD